MAEHMIDPTASTFGLPNCLVVPIAATGTDAIEAFVGTVVASVKSRNSRLSALCVVPHDYPVKKNRLVRLWQHENSCQFEQRLHPPKQVWVHVDYSGYRRAYIRFGMPTIPSGYFLDHVQNREAIRLREYSHPYLRLCPVSRHVNTSGGSRYGGEGLEKVFLRNLANQPAPVQTATSEAVNSEILYADPMDLTKMLDIPPGTEPLSGVREMLKLYYPDK